MLNLKFFKEIRDYCQKHNARLVAVTKTQAIESLELLYQSGQRVMGENRVQELLEKYEQLPKDIEWHLIGHLQTNKVKYIAPFVHTIHAVDSLKLLQEIDKQAQKHSRVIDCLLQLHIAQEESKFGMNEEELEQLLSSAILQDLKNVRIIGLMGMASFTEDFAQIRKEFNGLYRIFLQVQREFFANIAHFKELSMGMSGDYKIAIEEGSTMIRVGSLLFSAE